LPDDISTQHVVKHGRVYEEIIMTAKELGADLIVMSAHRHELSDYLLGPNAARVARHASQSVLIVR
jgi:nucleotide-binding universal stress UspA family protein